MIATRLAIRWEPIDTSTVAAGTLRIDANSISNPSVEPDSKPNIGRQG